MILKFSKKIIQKEWDKLSLTFFSVLLITFVISTSYLVIDSSKNFLITKNKEFIGGDVVFESKQIIDSAKFLGSEKFIKSDQITFSAVAEGVNMGEVKNSPINFKIVDANFPLYGEVKLSSEKYIKPEAGEIYLDKKAASDLGVGVNGKVNFNQKELTVKGIIESDPENISSTFAFLGNAIISSDSISYLNLNLDLFRKDYKTKIKLENEIAKNEKELIVQNARVDNVRARFDDVESGGLGFALDLVNKFLTVALIIVSILTLVNVYASVNYLTHRLRRSFAILISIGMSVKDIYKILIVINLFIVMLASSLGVIFSESFAYEILNLVKMYFSFDIPFIPNYFNLLVIFAVIIVTSMAAVFPVINRMRRISPKELLKNNENMSIFKNKLDFLFDVVVAILPILILSIYLLDSFLYGFLVVAIVLLSYLLIATLYHFFLKIISKYRSRFPFFLKMIFAQKSFDGFMGLVTFASLFVALSSVYTLSILRTSLVEYLNGDLGQNLPSVYILDVQDSQKDNLLSNFNDITLYPNVRARITKIDSLDVQDALEKKEDGVDRELGREFNLTFRNELLTSEKVASGAYNGSDTGYVSVEKDFAARANIKLGSQIEFNIQGFPVVAKVTSLREVDSRSGYPFFYFILSPEDISKFPKTFFGYGNYKGEDYQRLSKFLGSELPNVSIVNTESIKALAEQLIGGLLIIILIVTLPSILLSILLIIIILVSVSKERKRDGTRLIALGKETSFVRNYYILESTSTTVLASTFAYLFSLVVTNYVIMNFIKIESITIFDIISLYIILTILFGISMLSFFLWKSGKMSLRDNLNYEENN